MASSSSPGMFATPPAWQARSRASPPSCQPSAASGTPRDPAPGRSTGTATSRSSGRPAWPASSTSCSSRSPRHRPTTRWSSCGPNPRPSGVEAGARVDDYPSCALHGDVARRGRRPARADRPDKGLRARRQPLNLISVRDVARFVALALSRPQPAWCHARDRRPGEHVDEPAARDGRTGGRSDRPDRPRPGARAPWSCCARSGRGSRA